ncbi:MAG: hypothetical protein R2830_19300 [Saprospiraceae bacterium]
MDYKKMMEDIRRKEDEAFTAKAYADRFAGKYAEPEPDRHTIHLHLSDDEIGVLLSFCEKEIARLSKFRQTHERQKEIIRLEYIREQIVGNA